MRHDLRRSLEAAESIALKRLGIHWPLRGTGHKGIQSELLLPWLSVFSEHFGSSLRELSIGRPAQVAASDLATVSKLFPLLERLSVVQNSSARRLRWPDAIEAYASALSSLAHLKFLL